MARKFIYDGKELPDTDPSMTVDEIRQSLSEFFPELSNAEAKHEKGGAMGEDDIYTFIKRVGTKG